MLTTKNRFLCDNNIESLHKFCGFRFQPNFFRKRTFSDNHDACRQQTTKPPPTPKWFEMNFMHWTQSSPSKPSLRAEIAAYQVFLQTLTRTYMYLHIHSCSAQQLFRRVSSRKRENLRCTNIKQTNKTKQWTSINLACTVYIVRYDILAYTQKRHER